MDEAVPVMVFYFIKSYYGDISTLYISTLYIIFIAFLSI